VRTSGHTLEWDIKPFPFKVYTDAPAIALPREIDPVTVDTFAALTSRRLASPVASGAAARSTREATLRSEPAAARTATAPAAPGARFTLEQLTALLYYSAGVTKKKTYPGGGEVLFRAAASTGALHQTEVYV